MTGGDDGLLDKWRPKINASRKAALLVIWEYIKV